MAYLGLNPEAYVSKIKELQDISSQFDGSTNNFELRTTNNELVTVAQSMQLTVSLNGVMQQPNTASASNAPGSFWVQEIEFIFPKHLLQVIFSSVRFRTQSSIIWIVRRFSPKHSRLMESQKTSRCPKHRQMFRRFW